MTRSYLIKRDKYPTVPTLNVWWDDLGERRADEHAVLWDGRAAAGHPIASGIYHLLLEADSGLIG